MRYLYVFFYLSSILFANWLVNYFGIVSFGPLVFPAGAIAIGLTFSARDFVQREWGKWQCWIWMLVAAFITFLVNQKLAVASVAAFMVSELFDWLLYTYTNFKFKKRIIISNLISTPLDSIIFVSIAFGFMWPAVIGQTIVKFISSIIPIIFIKDNSKV